MSKEADNERITPAAPLGLIAKSFRPSADYNVPSAGRFDRDESRDSENAFLGRAQSWLAHTTRPVARRGKARCNSFVSKRSDCLATGMPAGDGDDDGGGGGGGSGCRGDRGGLREWSIAISNDAQSNERGRK